MRKKIKEEVGYTYNQNCNATQLTLNGTVMFTYHYNAQDRLVQVDDTNGAVIATYYYDPFGRRLWKEVHGERTCFFYADEGLVAEYDAAGTELVSYGYKPDSTWTTDPLWQKRNGEYYFYQNDHLGTPQKLVKANGAVVWSASYTAFGQATVEVQDIPNHLRFPGQYYDEETGLHYNFHRYYASGIGRYLRVDPIGFWGEDIHLYRYALNNPIRFFDPDGFNPYDTLFSCRNLFGGNNPLNRELKQWERRFPRQEAKRVLPPAPFLAAEGHVVLGGNIISYGLTSLTCCTPDNRAKLYVYEKECRGGIAITIGIGGGMASKMMGKDCIPERYEGWFLELAFGPIGIDIGFTEHETIAYPNGLSGVNEVSVNFGMGIKYAFCYYRLLWETECPVCNCKL